MPMIRRRTGAAVGGVDLNIRPPDSRCRSLLFPALMSCRSPYCRLGEAGNIFNISGVGATRWLMA